MHSRLFAALALVAGSMPAAALACGGFFCSNQPVDQTGEQILFVDLPDGRIQATVSIAYTGDTADFAWVVPVPGVPELSVGSDQVFAVLNGATTPSFQATLDESSCDIDNWWGEFPNGGDDDLDSGAGGGTTNEGDGGVQILLEETVGNYEAFVVGATAAQPLMDWLNCNDFRIAESSLPLVEAYLADGMNFLALRLVDAATEGALTPITMEYDSERPMVPIVLTAVATQPNLALQIFFAGAGRAVPLNYDLVWPNDALVDWTQPWNTQQWWLDLVGRAADAAGGHAFVPEFAGLRPSWVLDSLGPEGGWDLDPLRSIADPVRFVEELLMTGVPRTSLMQDLLRRHIPMPQALIDDGVTEQQFYNNLEAYRPFLGGIAFNADAFVSDVEELVTGPVENARISLSGDDRDVLTSLATSLSGWEMTADPMFAFLADGVGLEDSGAEFPRTAGIPQVRSVTYDLIANDPTVSCELAANVVDTDSGVRVVRTFPDGSLNVDIPEASAMPDCQDLPAAMIVERWTPDGEATVVQDLRPQIAAQAPDRWCAASAVTTMPTEPPEGVAWPPDATLMPLERPAEEVCASFESLEGTAPVEPPVPSCGCETAASPRAGWLLVLVLGAFGLRRRAR